MVTSHSYEGRYWQDIAIDFEQRPEKLGFLSLSKFPLPEWAKNHTHVKYLALDENSSFFERLSSAGVSTEFQVFQGAFHGSENLAPEIELSKKIWESRLGAIARFIEK